VIRNIAVVFAAVLIAGCGSSNSGPKLSTGSVYQSVAPNSVSTFAGFAGAIGNSNATGTAARFAQPTGVAVSPDGSTLFVADFANHNIRQIDVATKAVTTLAGSGNAAFANGTGLAASFNGPIGLATDGTNLYVTDYNNNAVRKIVIATGVVTTLAGSGNAGNGDGTGTAATFNNPEGITLSGDGTALYVTDFTGNDIRKIVIATGVVTRVSTNTGITTPAGIATDGTNLYVSEFDNRDIVKVVISTGSTSTLAGNSAFYGTADGVGSAASFIGPNGLTLIGTDLYLADTSSHLVRKIATSNGTVTTVAGVPSTTGSLDGTGAGAFFNAPVGIAGTSVGGARLYVGDAANSAVRLIQ